MWDNKLHSCYKRERANAMFALPKVIKSSKIHCYQGSVSLLHAGYCSLVNTNLFYCPKTAMEPIASDCDKFKQGNAAVKCAGLYFACIIGY
jgi:hypothetical protein